MSMNLYIVCVPHKENLWIGQQRYGRPKGTIYSGSLSTMKKLNDFLHEHRMIESAWIIDAETPPNSCWLLFCDEHVLDAYELLGES